MKKLPKYYSLLLILPLFFGCSSSSDDEDGIEEEIIKELKLSVAEADVESLTTEDVDFEFDILDGNGEYTASVSDSDGDEDAKVTIEGNKVTVNLLVGNGRGAKVTITDKKKKEASVYITSTHPSLHIFGHYGVFLGEGQTHTVDEFGAGGPYTVEKTRGNASNALIEDGRVKVTSLGLGNTYYKVRDKRGSVLNMTIRNSLQFEMTKATPYLKIEGINNLYATVTLLWGDEWEILSSTEKVTERISVGRPIILERKLAEHYVLFIHTTDTDKGTDTITLKNKEGDVAVVEVSVK